MTGVLIHDGRRTGHMGWSAEAIASRVASGIFISPFCTPRIGAPRNPSAEVLAKEVRDVSGEVIFDVETHARLLTGSDRLEHYDTWELWGSAGVGLDSQQRRLQHIERVFERQSALSASLLAPTQVLESPDSTQAHDALAAAELAAGLAPSPGQSLVGTRSFWRSGYRLDEYVGQLAALNSPLWVITLANEMVLDQIPDLGDTPAIEGLLRTIHSLSERSRVIMSHSDLSGLLAAAAGADSLGAGWDRSMRVFDPATYHVSSDPGPRIPASVVTQGLLGAVLRRDTAEAIERWNSVRALSIRGGPMPPSDRAERNHHLATISAVLGGLNGASTRKGRVDYLRDYYERAGRAFDELVGALRGVVSATDKSAWTAQQYAALAAYAAAEGLWT